MGESLRRDDDLDDVLRRVAVVEIDGARRSAMRFELMAEARAQKSGARTRAALVSARWIAVALGLTVALIGVFVYVADPDFGRPRDHSVADVTNVTDVTDVTNVTDVANVADVALAQIALEPGARGESLDGARLYRLIDGTAGFDVPHLTTGERFRVVAGDGLVEVRGTRFTVEVRDDQLAHVAVSRGRVIVRVAATQVADLRAGESWTRQSVIESESESESESATESESESEPESASESASGSESESESASAPVPHRRASRAHADEAFQHAFDALRSGDSSAAARAFDALLRDASLDAGRRADTLYWSALAHERAGDRARATTRARTLLRDFPDAWRANDARRLLARIAS